MHCPVITLRDCSLPEGPKAEFLGLSPAASAPDLSSIWIILTPTEKQSTEKSLLSNLTIFTLIKL